MNTTTTTIKGKQATRGQQLIYDENQETIRYYFLAASIVSPIVACAYLFLFESAGTGFWIGWTLAVILAGAAILFMMSMIKSGRNEKGKITDAGVDLNDPAAFGEYCKDAIILSCAAQVLSLIWSKFIFLIALIPVYAIIKLWTKVLAPWFFAPAPEDEAVDDKKLRKQQRAKFVKQR
uniref:Transmembrane protein 208 n=1 Tax=Panagrolaimus superbus TaxID=310955 RepID=A0A914Z246_9BILA